MASDVIEDRATSQRAVIWLRVEAAEPPCLFAFPWDYPEGAQPREGNSLRVEFTLSAEGGGTRLRVTEGGLAAPQRSGQDKGPYYAHLASLQDHVTRTS